MPPKKTTKAAAAAATKEKPVKQVKEKPVKQVKEPKEKKPIEEDINNEEVVPKQTKKTTKTKTPAPEPVVEAENGTTEKRALRAKKPAKEEVEELPSTSQPKKTTKARKTKKEEKEVDEAPEEVPAPSKTKAAAKKNQKRKAPEKEEEAEPQKKGKTAGKPANPTITDWSTIDFKCTTKTSTGKSSNFNILSWNVDGVRAWLKKGGLDILKHGQPDIVCLQETKCAEEKLPAEMTEIEGYETFWCSSEKDGYAGVAVLSKIKPINVVYGIDSEEHDDEGRCITAEYEKFYLVNVYVPNAGRRLVTLPKRLEWNVSFKKFIKDLDEKKPVIVCGDMNVAHTEIDLANPKTNTKNAGFTMEEREGLTDFLEDGYIDTFRKLYPDKEKAYTFWTYMSNARSKNVGWRLDYFIVSERFMDNVCDNIILHEILGSDHCPLTLHIHV